MVFNDRFEAGRMLADKLKKYKGKAIVLAIPRGGVEVGYALAKQLSCPLDIVISKKVPYPGQPELAIGAVCNDVVSLDEPLITAQNISSSYVKEEIDKLKATIKNRYKELTGKSKFPELKGRIVIITDDGIATGATLKVAIDMVKAAGVERTVVAIPVGPPENVAEIRQEVDDVTCLLTPANFQAVGQFYESFNQVEDEDVERILRDFAKTRA